MEFGDIQDQVQDGEVPRARSVSPEPAFGAIDVGTSSCRLLIARPQDSGFSVIDSFARNVRLGQGVIDTGRLNEQAMDRVIKALQICVQKLDSYEISGSRAVATAACRFASNSDLFVDRVAAETGIRIEVIQPDEEARLAVKGCAPLLNREQEHALIFDIGGGSTQVIWLRVDGPEPEILALHSIGKGVVSLTERYEGHLSAPKVYDDCVAKIAAEIAEFSDANGIDPFVSAGRVQMIGTSGTVTTLAGMELGLERYIRSRVDGILMDFDRITSLTSYLRELGPAQLAAQPCIGHNRADLMLAGCAILDAICHCWPVGRLRVADRGLREGILLELMEPSALGVRAHGA